MKTIYHYVLNGMAEWETGYILQISKSANADVKFVGVTKNPIKCMSGMTIVPDISIDEMNSDNASALILPGSDSWNNPENELILQKALTFLEKGIVVCAVCGATFALADLGAFENRLHTSNSLMCLKMFTKNYHGENFYCDKKSCRDKNLVTASSAGGLEFARNFADALELFSPAYIEAWYNYFSTNKEEYFAEMMKIGK